MLGGSRLGVLTRLPELSNCYCLPSRAGGSPFWTRRFTRKKHTRSSGIAMGFHPQHADVDQPLALQPLIRHPRLRRQRLRQVPVALAAEGCEDRVAFTRPQCQGGERVRSFFLHARRGQQRAVTSAWLRFSVRAEKSGHNPLPAQSDVPPAMFAQRAGLLHAWKDTECGGEK